jgi:DNA modification methylase
MIPTCEILIGDVRAKLRELRKRKTKVQCVVTSPPYWALRAYGTTPQVWGGRRKCEHVWGPAGALHRGGPQGDTGDRSTRDTTAQDETGDVSTGQFCTKCRAWLGELGLEPTPELFVKHTVEVFRDLWHVLADNGTLWMNFGDSYCSSDKWGGGKNGNTGKQTIADDGTVPSWAIRSKRPSIPGLKPKDLVGMPWRIAFALQADGWYLRQEIIWAKPNPMPESVTDRCTKAHEHIFLLTKSPRYFFDADAIKEKTTGTANPRGTGVNPKSVGVGFGYMEDKPRALRPISGWATEGSDRSAITHAKADKDEGRDEQGLRDSTKFGRGPGWRNKQNESFSAAVNEVVDVRNKRSVWSVPTEPYAEAHYATFPRDLIRPCILAGTKQGDVVLDPFGGSGTTGAVALEYGRNAILIDLNPANETLMRGRMAPHAGQGVLAV